MDLQISVFCKFLEELILSSTFFKKTGFSDSLPLILTLGPVLLKTTRDFQGRMMIDREQHKPLWAAFQKLFMMMAESQKDIHDEENL